MLLAESAPAPPETYLDQVSELRDDEEDSNPFAVDTPSGTQSQDADWQLGGPLSGAVLAACWRWRQGEALWEAAEGALRGLLPMESFEQNAASEGTLVILDWDDTLFPTTALSMSGRLLTADPEGSTLDDLVPCALAARQALQVAKRLGKVIIVTNAIRGWVQEMVGRFLPILEPELADVPVISARSIYEPQGIADPSHWKPLCFQRVLRFFQGRRVLRHVISIGDSWFERAAVLKVGEDLAGTCNVKSLKLLGMPSVDDISRQLDICARNFEWIFSFDGALDLWVHPAGGIEVVTNDVLAGTWQARPAPPQGQFADEAGEGEVSGEALLDTTAGSSEGTTLPPPDEDMAVANAFDASCAYDAPTDAVAVAVDEQPILASDLAEVMLPPPPPGPPPPVEEVAQDVTPMTDYDYAAVADGAGVACREYYHEVPPEEEMVQIPVQS